MNSNHFRGIHGEKDRGAWYPGEETTGGLVFILPERTADGRHPRCGGTKVCLLQECPGS